MTYMEYAKQTAADNDCEMDAAVRMMRDEPAEVARKMQASADDVTAWCDLYLTLST